MLKVDILNVMGVSMLAAAVLWGLGRIAMAAGAAAGGRGGRRGDADANRPRHAAPALAARSDRVVSASLSGAHDVYAVSVGRVPAGGGRRRPLARCGADRTATNVASSWAFAVGGPVMAMAATRRRFCRRFTRRRTSGRARRRSSFCGSASSSPRCRWRTSWSRLPGRSPMQEFGIASLFVYWIHVEMVYGVVSTPIHRQLTFASGDRGLRGLQRVSLRARETEGLRHQNATI